MSGAAGFTAVLGPGRRGTRHSGRRVIPVEWPQWDLSHEQPFAQLFGQDFGFQLIGRDRGPDACLMLAFYVSSKNFERLRHRASEQVPIEPDEEDLIRVRFDSEARLCHWRRGLSSTDWLSLWPIEQDDGTFVLRAECRSQQLPEHPQALGFPGAREQEPGWRAYAEEWQRRVEDPSNQPLKTWLTAPLAKQY